MKQNTLLLVLLSTLHTCAIHGVESTIDTNNKRTTSRRMSKEDRSWLNIALEGGLWDPNNRERDPLYLRTALIEKLEGTESDYIAMSDDRKSVKFNERQISKLLIHGLITQDEELLKGLADSPDARVLMESDMRFAMPLYKLVHCDPVTLCTFSSWLIHRNQCEDFSLLLEHALDEHALDQRWTGVIKNMVKTALAHPNDTLTDTFAALSKEDWPTLYHIVGIKDFCEIYKKEKLMGLSPSEQDDRLKHLKQLLKEFKLTECRLIKRKTKFPRGVVGEIAKYF